MIKGSIQEDMIVINTSVYYMRAPKYIEQILTNIKRDIDSSTIIVVDSTHLHQGTGLPDRTSIRKHWP